MAKTMDKDHLSEETCFSLDYEKTALRNMHSFYLEQSLCDFCVKVEGHSFQVHRVVLASCSDYFKAIFSHDMLESRQEFVDLKGLTEKGVRPLITFAYAGYVDLSFENIQDVICAATFLQIQTAVDLCIDYLKKKMTFDNAEELLSIAEILSIPALKIYYRSYILENFSQFSETEAFLKLDAETLASYLSDDKLRTDREINLLKSALRWYEHQSQEQKRQCYCVFDNIRYVNDGWPAINYASHYEPFTTDIEFRRIVRSCCDYMENAEKRYLFNDHRSRVRFEHKTLIQYCGVITIDDEVDDLHLLQDLEDRCGWNRNHFYHSDLRSWFPMGILRVKGEPLSHMTFTEVKDHMVVVGGYEYEADEDLASRQAVKSVCAIMTSQFNAWDLASLQHERAKHATVYIPGPNDTNGNIYAIGGRDNRQALCSVERHICDESVWQYVKPLPKPLYDHKAAVYRGKIYVTGGVESHQVTNKVWCYDPAVNKWKRKEPMLQARASHGMACIQDKLVVCGGYKVLGFLMPLSESTMDDVELYNFETKQWTKMNSMIQPVHDMGIAVLNGKLVVGGGELMDGELTSVIQQFDLQQNSWTIYGRLQRPLKALGLAACTVKFIKVGGKEDRQSAFDKTFELIEAEGDQSFRSEEEEYYYEPEYFTSIE